jgi:hypothetical protein
VKPIHILQGIDPLDHALLADLAGQGELHQDPVD